MRQIVLDTETTGLDPKSGHRMIEVGCVELIDRKLTSVTFHHYLNPDREVEAEAIEVHGITNEFLSDKPRFFDVVDELIAFIDGAELIAHNASFDVGFLNHEFKLTKKNVGLVSNYCQVFDTLKLARKLHPGQRNSLDALSKRYHIEHFNRKLHGALLDAEILAQVYLAMTGGQRKLFEDMNQQTQSHLNIKVISKEDRLPLSVIKPSEQELSAHESYLTFLKEKSGRDVSW